MTTRVRWLVIGVLVAILIGLRLWDWYTGDPSVHQQRIDALEEAAESLYHIAQESRLEAIAARADLVEVTDRLTAERQQRALERQRLEQQSARLDRKLEELTAELHAPVPLETANLTDLELSRRVVASLSLFVPEVSAVELPPVPRPVLEATILCTHRYGVCREALDVAVHQAATLGDRLQLEVTDRDGWRTQAETCGVSETACHAALAAAAQLEANRMQQLEARALQVQSLERKLWTARIHTYALTAGAAVAGYAVGRNLQ